jgi:hypothetical protein
MIGRGIPFDVRVAPAWGKIGAGLHHQPIRGALEEKGRYFSWCFSAGADVDGAGAAVDVGPPVT